MPDRPSHPRATRRAETWLARHGLRDTPATPLLLARLAVRRRARAAMIAVMVVVGALAIAANTVVWNAAQQPTALSRLLPLIIVVIVGVLVRWAWQRLVVLGDRRIAAGLTRRAAHHAPPGWRAMLGRRIMVIAAVTHAGALAITVAAAALAHTDQHRALAIVMLLALAALAAIAAAEIAEATRRPTLADDATSLAVDDALRAEDARAAATSPMSALLAAFAATTVSPDAAPSLATVSYLLVGFAVVADMWTQSSTPSRPFATS